jgi:hypothetical protein
MVELRKEFEDASSPDEDKGNKLTESGPDSTGLEAATPQLSGSSLPTAKFPKTFDGGNVVLGSLKETATFEVIEHRHSNHPFLKNLGDKLSAWLSTNLPLYGEEVPGGRVCYQPNDKVRGTSQNEQTY